MKCLSYIVQPINSPTFSPRADLIGVTAAPLIGAALELFSPLHLLRVKGLIKTLVVAVETKFSPATLTECDEDQSVVE